MRWELAAAAVAGLGLASRLHNAFAYPALLDFDGAGHALNSFALASGRWPDPRSWSGFHPPLAYALGAALWRLAPEAVPVHALLRMASTAAAAGAVALVARVLWLRLPTADAAIVAALAFCAPVTAIASSMIGNECLCALLVTAALAWQLRPVATPIRDAAVSGLLTGAATLAKSTGLVAIAAAALSLLWRLRKRPGRWAPALGVLVGTAALLTAPHALRLLGETGGSPLAVVSGGVGSPDARAAMASQPPGERGLGDYLRVPTATLLRPFYLEPGMLESVPGLLYASTWADAHAALLPPAADPRILPAQALLAVGGLLPTALALLGGLRALREPRHHPGWLAPFVFAGLLALAFVLQTWLFPHYSAVKASYLLPALLPASYLIGVGLGALAGGARLAVRAALLGLATASTAVTTYGWWG